MRRIAVIAIVLILLIQFGSAVPVLHSPLPASQTGQADLGSISVGLALLAFPVGAIMAFRSLLARFR